jgi:hypothetical protein
MERTCPGPGASVTVARVHDKGRPTLLALVPTTKRDTQRRRWHEWTCIPDRSDWRTHLKGRVWTAMAGSFKRTTTQGTGTFSWPTPMAEMSGSLPLTAATTRGYQPSVTEAVRLFPPSLISTAKITSGSSICRAAKGRMGRWCTTRRAEPLTRSRRSRWTVQAKFHKGCLLTTRE